MCRQGNGDEIDRRFVNATLMLRGQLPASDLCAADELGALPILID